PYRPWRSLSLRLGARPLLRALQLHQQLHAPDGGDEGPARSHRNLPGALCRKAAPMRALLTTPEPMRATEEDDLVQRLMAEPERFDFTTAVHVAERAGELRLVADVGSGLAATPIAAVERRDGGVEIRSSVGGLVGALGALPPAYTQAVLE